ncbi:MAG: Fur family transcriptional regulator [Gammaproteobacteria bacterium]|nr:Fur family transcriptional regulator [Gammaproteobacteria bacterium]
MFWVYNEGMGTGADPILNPDEATALLREHGIAPTRQRVAVSAILFACRQHMAASDLFRRVRASDTSISRSTVYNTLELFVEKGLLQELNFGDSPRIYDTNLAPHHHLYHVDSGKIEDLDVSQIKVKVPDEVLGNSSLVGVDVTLRVAG